MEIPLELQLKEANRRIKMHLSKGRKFQQFLSPMFLWHFPRFMVLQTHLGQGSKIGHAPISFVVLLLVQLIPVD